MCYNLAGENMSNEYIALPTNEQDLGLLTVSKAVVESIAAIAVSEVPNVKLVDKTTLRNPVICKIIDKALFLSVDIRIMHDSDINQSCLAVQSRINQALAQMVGLTCQNIDVRIVGFIF